MDDTKCVRCGSDFPSGGVYCPVCGARRSNVGLWVKEARNAATRAIDVSVEALGRASKEVADRLRPAAQETAKAARTVADKTAAVVRPAVTKIAEKTSAAARKVREATRKRE